MVDLSRWRESRGARREVSDGGTGRQGWRRENLSGRAVWWRQVETRGRGGGGQREAAGDRVGGET